MEDIRTNGHILGHAIQSVSTSALKKGKTFPANSIIVSTSATIGEHGLLQAFSRTNRILNSVKTFGNIICFRKRLKKETDDAISLFGDKDAGGIVILKPFDDYFNGYDDDKGHHPGYSELLDELNEKYPFGSQIIGEENEKAFIKLFSALLRLRNILTAFDEFDAKDTLSPFLLQNYTSEYLDLHEARRRQQNFQR